MARPKDENAALAVMRREWGAAAKVAGGRIADLEARLAEAEKQTDEAEERCRGFEIEADALQRVRAERDEWKLEASRRGWPKDTAQEFFRIRAERDHWHDEYLACCKSLTKRVHQGAEAVRERDRLRDALEQLDVWASRMPDAGFDESDLRWQWWHERPRAALRTAQSEKTSPAKKPR